MSTPQYDSGPTSNDLLGRLIAKHAHARPSDPNVAQGAVDSENTETTPPVNVQRLQRDL